MQLHTVDWLIIIGYFGLTLGIGLAFSRRAGSSVAEYFASGRSLPWWLAGTSMVATTFAVDTPLAVTGLVAKDGLAGNWFWWAFAMGGMITVFVFAKLWRRAEVLTDVELIEMRYGGRPAAVLRGFRSLYVALIINPIIIGWVTKAMVDVLKYTVLPGDRFGAYSDWLVILVCLSVVGVYSTLAGLWGVAVSDVIQFCLAMLGCVLLAIFAVQHVGGISALQETVTDRFGGGEQAFAYLPDFSADQPWLPLDVFLIIILVQWWATWYPGAEPGGGGYVVQRMASCKDERHAIWATLWFQVAHYCLRPWPWLIVAFVSLAMFPEIRDWALTENPPNAPGVGFPMVMAEVSPVGLRGLMLVTFFAAFMSTLSTQMNWGASYLVNDFYCRFFAPNASEKHLTRVSRVTSVFVLVLGGVVSWIMVGANMSVDDAWKFLAALGAGTGAVFMLRWFWYRINAWTEISSMVASLAFFALLQSQPATKILQARDMDRAEYRMLLVALLTMATWLIVTFVTKPEKQETLIKFYEKVRPDGIGWRPIAALADVETDGNLGLSILAALFAAGMIYFTLPAVGALIFEQYRVGFYCGVTAIICAIVTALLTKKLVKTQ